MSLTLALTSGLAAIAGSIALQMRLRQIRKRHLSALELRPNCLLTRHPIVFVASPRSVFRLFSPWNNIPAFLREHGYEVLVLEPPSKADCASAILRTFERLDGKHHLIGDSSLEPVFMSLAQERHPKIATLTLAKNRRTETRRHPARPPSPEDLKPLPSTIETLDIEPRHLEGRPRDWVNFASLALLSFHNAFSFGRRRKIDALETGHVLTKSWDIESRFLDLAISLAERDAQWCD